MEERSEGIILRTRPLTETSLIVNWLTAEQGRISTVAKGARRPKSPFAGKLDLCFEAEFSYVRSRRSELHALREVTLVSMHPELRSNYMLLRQAAYFTVLIEKGTESETPLPEMHALLARFLNQLPTARAEPETVLRFEFRFLRLLGMEPDLDAALMKSGPGERPVLSPETRRRLNQRLRAAIAAALDWLPPQREAALDDSDL